MQFLTAISLLFVCSDSREIADKQQRNNREKAVQKQNRCRIDSVMRGNSGEDGPPTGGAHGREGGRRVGEKPPERAGEGCC